MDKETKGVFESLINALKARNEADEKDEKKEEKEVENKCKNADEDKRKLIDEIAGIMKSAGADDELIRTAIAKMEKLAYDKSKAGTADNEEEEEEKKEEKPAENKCKNEDDEKYEKLKEEVEKEAENKKAKNSIEALKSVFFDGSVQSKKLYMSQKDGIELGKKLY